MSDDTRYGNVVKLQVRPGSVGSTARASTTRLYGSHAMPSKDITRRRDVNRAHHERAIARNRAFIEEINARTVCAHCGVQPIEWHNPEHVLPGRALYRISHMVRTIRAIAAIRAELDRCTPLCRRCHMKEDGRMSVFLVQARKSKTQPPKPCIECHQPAKPLRRQRCEQCYERHRSHMRRDKPCASGLCQEIGLQCGQGSWRGFQGERQRL
jgi:hypothetical protein